MKRFTAIILLATLLLLSVDTVVAETTNLRQRILPIDCIYEVIDIGTQTLRYVTPETCPIDPGPPIVTEPIGQPTIAIADKTPISKWVYLPSVSAETPTDNVADEPDVAPQTQGRVATIIDEIFENTDSLLITILFSCLTLGLLMTIKHKKQQ